MKTKQQTANERLKIFREALNLSTTELFEKTNISKSLIEKMEAGTMPVSEKTAKTMQMVFALPVEWLLDDEGEMTYTFEKTKEPWEREAWAMAKDQIKTKDATIERLAVSFDRLTEFLSKVQINFLHPVKETA